MRSCQPPDLMFLPGLWLPIHVVRLVPRPMSTLVRVIPLVALASGGVMSAVFVLVSMCSVDPPNLVSGKVQ